MNQEICPAAVEDIDALAQLLDSLFSQDLEFQPDHAKQTNGLRAILENPAHGEILVLKIDGAVIGMVSLLYSISTALGGKVAIFEDMIIDKDFRNSRNGTMLLTAAIAFAKKRHCLRITLLTDFNNDGAIHFYEKAGFETSKMIPMRLLLEE